MMEKIFFSFASMVFRNINGFNFSSFLDRDSFTGSKMWGDSMILWCIIIVLTVGVALRYQQPDKFCNVIHVFQIFNDINNHTQLSI
jgi:hypothetical protein